jgi:hypothetical protein
MLATALGSIVDAGKAVSSWNFVCSRTASLTTFENRHASIPVRDDYEGRPLATFFACALRRVRVLPNEPRGRPCGRC